MIQSCINKTKWKNQMKTIISTIALIVGLSTTGHANEVQHTLIPAHKMEPEVQCSNTDVAIGIGATVVASIVVGIVTVATSPITTGGVVGYAAATSGVILTGSTLPTIAVSHVILAPTLGITSYWASCVYNAVTK
jgi:hypothetical protein